jgi:hypothetical protein
MSDSPFFKGAREEGRIAHRHRISGPDLRRTLDALRSANGGEIMQRSMTIAVALIAALASGASAQARAQAATRSKTNAAARIATPTPAASTPVAVKASTPAPLPADTGSKVLINREVFQYEGDGRRDPFVSLLTTSDLRPLLTDLKLVAVAFDPRGQNSVAVLRDVTSKDQYRVRVGQTIGRMRVAAIQEKDVIFTIEEFGYSRQEILPFVVDSTKMRPRQ